MEDDPEQDLSLVDVDADSFRVLQSHPFCRTLRNQVVLAISRASKQWAFTTKGRIIINEKVKSENSGLWILTRGSVEVVESGRVLGTLEAGSIFGDAVAFGRCDQQPFSIHAREIPVIAWCWPAVELQQLLKAQPMAKAIMDQFVDQQEKQLLRPLASKLIMLSHAGPEFTEELLNKMEVRHYRASNTIWSPLSTHASMRVVITGRVLVQKKLDGTCADGLGGLPE
ncbi:Cyclic nucleotide-binding domain-containing protein [Durusdinium trenchii]|uniref:Cyclic nucleotide-binding domain-containing protein n=1 Tax=Durusdinium trenchii TaxID=1381693 RepID=A0ABP0MT21_9DINO